MGFGKRGGFSKFFTDVPNLEKGEEMEYIQEYFLCDSCKGKDFTPIHNFSISFHGVNFSDELIYDEVTEEIYKCTKCEKVFTPKEITEALAEIKRKRKSSP